MRRNLLGVAAAVLGTVLISGAGLTTAASAAAPVDTVVTLPLFGAALSFDIATDPGGAITQVTVTPADASTVATKLRPHKVVFQSADPTNSSSTARIVIKSGHGGQSVSARAGSLADFTATGGGWSGDVFGTGAASSVPFTIGDAGDGTPTITVGTPVPASGVTAVVGAVQLSSGDGHEGDSGSSARVSVKFTNSAGDQSRSLTIAVKVQKNEDGGTSAKLSISLGRMRGVEGKAVGAHTWTGSLCDNTAASIGYTVDANGTLALGAITPISATSSTGEEGTTVTFATGERVRISSKMDDNGQVHVNVKVRIDCGSPNPTTNVTTSIPTPDMSGHKHLGDSGSGDHNGGSDG